MIMAHNRAREAVLTVMVLTWFTSQSVNGNSPDGSEDFVPLTASTLPQVIHSPSLSIIFFNTKASATEDLKLENFLHAYSSSAKLLQYYNIKLALFDCTTNEDSEGYCAKEQSASSVYAFQNGKMLMTLETEFLFDVDSIMSNVLQLAMVREVPIVQSQQEREKLQQSVAGQHDLLFINPGAVGMPAHRMFMEVAYAYQGSLKFAVTTEGTATLGLQDTKPQEASSQRGLWVLFCTEVSAPTSHCPNILYRGGYSLAGLTRFVQKLLEKRVLYAPKDDIDHLLTETLDEPVVFVYSLPDVEEAEKPIMQFLTYSLRSLGIVVFLDMSDTKCQELAEQQGMKDKMPNIAVRTLEGIMQFHDAEKWILEDVMDFLQPLLFPNQLMRAEKFNPGMNLGEEEDETEEEYELRGLINEVETQDDQVAAAMFHMRNEEIPSLSLVPALLKDSFYRQVQHSQLLVVLFYQPFDHLSMAFLREYGAAAEILATNFSTTNLLVRVDCFDATDLCSAENVNVFPTTRIYKVDGSTHQDYVGSLDALSVLKAAKLMQLKSPIQLTTEDEVELFMRGNHPSDFSKFTPSSVILLSTTSDSTFQQVSEKLSQVTALATVHPSLTPQIAEKYAVSVPSLVAVNREDKIQPIRTITMDPGSVTYQIMAAFVRASTIPLVPELGPENFPHLYARQQPLLVLFLDRRDQEVKDTTLTSFSKLAASGRFPANVFCWMDAQPKTLGRKILSTYTSISKLPVVTLVRHRQGQVFNFDPSDHQEEEETASSLQIDELSAWLEQVLSGLKQPSKILEQGEWGPPGRHYNFLNMSESFRGDGYSPHQKRRLGLEEMANSLPGPLLQEEQDVRNKLMEQRQMYLLTLQHQTQTLTSKGENSIKHVQSHEEL